MATIGPLFWPIMPASAQPQAGCVAAVALINGGFEQPTLSSDEFGILLQENVPGWRTTASDGRIELWHSGFNGVPAGEGQQFAELNANQVAHLYQDVDAPPGQTIHWRLLHRGRKGEDTMRVIAGPPGGPFTSLGDFTDGTTSWGEHDGAYLVPAGQTVTRFGFVSVSSAGTDPTMGNFLDGITFGTPACIQTNKVVDNLADHVPAQVGDVLQYTVTVSNGGGSGADSVIVTDAIPPFAVYKAGSLAISTDGIASARTDGPGDDTAEFDSAQALVRFRIGIGATATAGGSLAPGQVVVVGFQVVVQPSAADRVILNSSTIDSVDPVTMQAVTTTSNQTVTPVEAAADVAVTKTLDDAQVIPGQRVHFTVTVTNNGPSDATEVTIDDLLAPDLFDAVGQIVGGSPCVITDDIMRCAIGNVAVGEVVPVAIEATVELLTTTPTVASNIAIVAGAERDPLAANNIATVSAPIDHTANVAIEKVALTDPAVPGQMVSWRIKMTNAGPAAARGVVMTDLVPSGVTGVTVLNTDGRCLFTQIVAACTVDNLEVGATALTTLTGTLIPGYANTDLTDTATVSTASIDEDLSDNTDTITVPMHRQADLSVVKTPATATVAMGDLLSYDLVVTNNGPSATYAILTDRLPEGLVFVSADPSTGRFEPDTGAWTTGLLRPRDSTTLTLVVQATSQQTVTNTSTVLASFASDPILDNNISRAIVNAAHEGTAEGELPRTGVSVAAIVAVALALIFGGVLAVGAARKA